MSTLQEDLDYLPTIRQRHEEADQDFIQYVLDPERVHLDRKILLRIVDADPSLRAEIERLRAREQEIWDHLGSAPKLGESIRGYLSRTVGHLRRTVAGQCKQIRKLSLQAEAAEREADRWRAAIQAAPHADDCELSVMPEDLCPDDYTCTCEWKARALKGDANGR